MHDAVKVMGVLLLAVLSAGCGQQKKETTKGLLHKTEDFAGTWMGKNAFLEVTYNQFDSTYWLELLKVDEKNAQLKEHLDIRIVPNRSENQEYDASMLIVDSQSRIQILKAKPTISGFRAVGHTLTAENKHRDEVKYDIGYEFELNSESKRLNIFAILGSGEELNMFRSDISQADYLAEYVSHKLYEPKFSEPQNTFFKKLEGVWNGPDSRGWNYTLKFELSPLGNKFREMGRRVGKDGETQSLWTHFSTQNQAFKAELGPTIDESLLTIFSAGSGGFGLTGKWVEIENRAIAQYEAPDLRLIRHFENENNLRCTWENLDPQTGKWEENGNYHTLRRTKL